MTAIMPQRIQIRRTPGWRIPAGVVIVDRRTKWGNWYRGPGAGEAFRQQLASLYGGGPACIEARVYPPLTEIRAELGGRDLGCWCGNGLVCHADVLITIANEGDLSAWVEQFRATAVLLQPAR